MQDPKTATGLCAGVPIYEPCDQIDVDSLNSIGLEIRTAVEKLLGQDPVDLDCADSATYDQLCRGIQKAIADAVAAKPADATAAQIAALKADPSSFGVEVCLPGGGRAVFPADCFVAEDDGGPTDPTCVVGSTKTINMTNSGGTNWTVGVAGTAGWTTSGGVSSNGVQWRGALPVGCPDGVYRNVSSFDIPANQSAPGVPTVFEVVSCP